MNKPKPKKSTPKRAALVVPPAARPSTPAPAVAPGTGDEAAPLTPKETQRLLRISRFLLTIRNPALYHVAQAHGYTLAEHEEGWTLFRRASGEGMALRGAPHDPSLQPRYLHKELQPIDAFENLWFPRARAVIERVVPAPHRATFLATFFRDLTQQPLGPGVIVSVRTFLERVAALSTSTLPGAAAVRDTLRARGLTDDVLAAMRDRIAALERAPTTVPAPSPTPDARADYAAQRAAYEALSAWFNDWSTTLRSAYNKRDLLFLGLRTPSHKGSSAQEEDDPLPDED
jgi:hypothetical protein